MAEPLRITVVEGDQTGQEILEQSLRVLETDVLALQIELVRFDLSLARRRATGNGVVHEAAASMRETGLGLKAATMTPRAATTSAPPKGSSARRSTERSSSARAGGCPG